LSATRWLFVLVVLASALVDFSTDTPYLPGSYIGPFYRLWPPSQTTSAVCAAVFCLLAVLALWAARRQRLSENPDVAGKVMAIVLRMLPLPAMVFAFAWIRPHVLGAMAWPFYALAVTATVVLAVGALRRWDATAIAGVVACAGVAIRLIYFSHFPIEVGADMLPLTRGALTNLMAGRTPYSIYYLPAPLPLTYYPLTWLAYLPPFLLHLDLRWTNLAAGLAIPAGLFFVGVRGAHRAQATGSLAWPWDLRAGHPALLAWAFLFLLPSSIYFDRITTAPVMWSLLAWTLIATNLGLGCDWLLVGLLGAATPLAAVLAPFVLLAWLHAHGRRGAVIRSAKALGVAAAIIGPFLLWSPRGFIDGAVLWFNDLARFPGTKWAAFGTWQRYVGFGGLFWRAGRQRLLAPIQWTLVGAIAALYWRRRSDKHRLAAHAAAAFAVFMTFNSVHWPYFLQPVTVCGLVALAVAFRQAAGPARTRHS